LILSLAPERNRSFYTSAFNFTNGWLMAGGPILGGLLADCLPVTAYHLPGGLPLCYFHILLVLALLGAAGSLAFLLRSPALRPALPTSRAEETPPTANVDKSREYATI
jgi:MFS family permease